MDRLLDLSARHALAQIPSAIGVLVGTPSNGKLPINHEPTTWGTIENISQYLYVTDDQGTISEKLKSGQPLSGVGIFARFG